MIGIFDSGIGGLTVVKELMGVLPDYQLCYFGDTARTPYGTKSPTTIKKYALEDAHFLLNQGADIIVVACNTVSAVASDLLKQKLSVPVFEVITPAVKKALTVSRNKKIGVIGTRATIFSHIYERQLQKLDSRIEVFGRPCALFVPLVEENWILRPETKTIAKKYLRPLLSEGIDTLILGCTHYPLLRPIIQQIVGKRVTLVDPAEETVAAVRRYLGEHSELSQKLSRNKPHSFYLSDVTDQAAAVARDWLGLEVPFQITNLE